MPAPATRPPLAIVFAIVATVVLVLLELHVLDWTFEAIGVPHRWFGGLLLASIVGSSVNLPVGSTHTATGGRTIVAVNLGGAVIPVILSLWALASTGAWLPGLLATAVVAAVAHVVARPVPRLGIALPLFVPAPAAALAAMLLAPGAAAGVAYASASLGTLLGADLLNLRRLESLDVPVASIGGAGTFDGIFVAGVLAALLA